MIVGWFQGYKQKTKHPTGERLEKRKKKMKETEAQAKLSLKLQAYQYLKTKILNCEYRPNEFLNEQKFEMRLLGEPYALRTYGADIPREELEHFVQMMHEPDVIDDFCKADDDFHELLMSTLPNKYLRSAYDRITGLNTRFRIMTGKVSMINREQTCEEHLEILEPALKGDWNTAADALQKHLEIARDKAEGVIKVIRLW